MFIRFNITSRGETSYVYAWSENSNNKLTYAFHHTPTNKSLKFNGYAFSCENDNYVTFKCSINIDDWRFRLEASDYNSPDQYRVFSHNCAHAARFALEAAGIKVHSIKSPTFFNRINPYPLRIPLGTLSPYDLYQDVKDYKFAQLLTMNAEAKYQFTELRIKLWCAFTSLNKEKQLVGKIIDEIHSRHQRYPEHTEAQIDVLMQTYHLITRIPTLAECDEYLHSSQQFMQRVLSKQSKFIFCFYTIAYLIGLGIGCYLNNPFSNETSIFKKTSLAGGVVLNYLSVMRLFHFKKQTVETELSTSMQELAQQRYKARIA